MLPMRLLQGGECAVIFAAIYGASERSLERSREGKGKARGGDLTAFLD